MKKTKILLALLLTALFVLSALGSGENSSSSDVPVEDDYVADVYEPEAEEPVEEAKEFTRGVVDGDVYTNEFLGFTFTKPSDWRFLSDEEMAERMNTTMDVFEYNSVEEALAETATMYDMYVGDAYGNSAIIIYENLMITAQGTVTIDEYIYYMEAQFQNLSEYDYEILSQEEVYIGDSSFTKLTSVMTYQGQEITQASYIKIVGEYAVTITVTPTTETIDSIEAMFN